MRLLIRCQLLFRTIQSSDFRSVGCRSLSLQKPPSIHVGPSERGQCTWIYPGGMIITSSSNAGMITPPPSGTQYRGSGDFLHYSSTFPIAVGGIIQALIPAKQRRKVPQDRSTCGRENVPVSPRMSKCRHLDIHACAEALAFVSTSFPAFPSSVLTSPAFGGGSLVGFGTFPMYPCFPGCLACAAISARRWYRVNFRAAGISASAILSTSRVFVAFSGLS